MQALMFLTSNPYIPYDPNIILVGIRNLLSSVGMAWGYGMQIFFIFAGITLVVHVVRSVGGI